jgi:predicted phosphodiesterase
MKVKQERIEEIRKSVKEYGKDYTAEKYGLKRETVRRYMRLNKSSDGNGKDTKENHTENLPLDLDNSILLQKLSEKYSPGELKQLLDDKFQPESKETVYDFSGDVIKFAVISDMHIGSQSTNEDRIRSALDECIQQNVSLVLFSGDITEGMSGRDGHVYELRHIGYHAQRQAAINILSEYSDDMDLKMISGNHDLWYASKANMGALIVKDICESIGAEYLGEHESVVMMNGVKVMLWHGEDGASYALSYRAQKIIESFTGGEKPQILITGHDHKQGYFIIRNVHTILGGCIQKQTPWMRRKKLAAYEGFWIIEATIKDAEVKKFKPEWIPFYI